MIIKYRDKLSPLRIVNLSGNKINERKAKTRIEALKKMGIINCGGEPEWPEHRDHNLH